MSLCLPSRVIINVMYSYTWDKSLDWFCSDTPRAPLFDMVTSVTVVSMCKFCMLVFIVVTGGPTAGDPPTVNHKWNIIKIVYRISQWQSSQVWNLRHHYFYVSYFRATHAVLLFRYMFLSRKYAFISDISRYPESKLWRSWLRHCATSWKVAGSIPDVVIGIFHWHNPSGLTMALGLTQPLKEMSSRNIS